MIIKKILEGQKGQSSSVFNLLIAALVSLAILGLLLGIMGGIGFNQGNDPVDTSAKTINDARNLEYSVRSGDITFSKKNNEIPMRTLATKTDVGEGNIILYVCDELSQNITSDGMRIIYSGTSDLKSTVYAICGTNVQSTEFNRCSVSINPTNPNIFQCHLIVGPKQ